MLLKHKKLTALAEWGTPASLHRVSLFFPFGYPI